MLLAQSLLGHSYQLLRPLSSGGTGTIHLAQDIHQTRQVAVKVVPVDSAPQENSRVIQRLERLFQEKMQALTQLNHARIVPIFDSGLDTSGDAAAFYVVMAYCPEGSLADRLAEGTRLAPAEVVSVLTQTAEALHHAHERGVIHQDLKPSNLLISPSASLSDPAVAFADLQLADAGLAPFFAGLTGQGISQSPYARGTSMFIAPEQWDGQAVPASDQYALAVMAFYLLTGQYPFQGSLSQLIQQHHSARPPAPSTFNRQLGAPIDKIIRRALAKQPEKRFPSVLDFAQAFASAPQSVGTQPAASVLPVPRPAPGSIPALFSAPLPVQSALTTQLARQEEAAPDLAASSASHDDPAAEKTVLAPAPSSAPVVEATILAAAPTPDLAVEATVLAQAGDDSTILPVPALESADKDATLLAQPPDLTSTEPRLVAQPPSLTSDVPTQLAPEPSGARGPAERPATRPFGLSAAFSAALAIRPASGGLAGQSALSLKQAPILPSVLPALPANQASIRRWRFSTLQKSLVVILLSLVVLLSSGAFLVNSIIAASHARPGGTGLANGSNDGGGITIIVSPTGVDQTPAAGSTSTPTSSTSGNGTTPNTGTTPSTGSTPRTGTTPSTGSTPNSGAGPVPTPTTAPAPKPTPVPTPKPTPHPCVVSSWSSTLSPTFSAGGTEHFVSSYCNGVVSMTWTATPPSGGHEVDMQICFALRTTNCSAWVRFTGANVWKVVITGLHSGQGFYINNRCPACTGSAFKIYGEVKY